MALPIDLSCSLWMIPAAVWEMQDDVASNLPNDLPTDDPATANAAAASPGCPTNPSEDNPAAPKPGKLVFKGFVYQASYSWLLNDSPISQPWLRLNDAIQMERDDEDDEPEVVLEIEPDVVSESYPEIESEETPSIDWDPSPDQESDQN